MRVSISWLRELVRFDATPAEVAERLTLAGVEVTKIEEDDRSDTVLDLDILPNIARCQAMWGVAREVAAVVPGALLDRPQPRLKVPTHPLDTADFDPDLCRRFAWLRIDGIRLAATPDWMWQRLVSAGVPPVSNVVDTANYVMLELGQPLHTYDADLLPRARFSVRTARPGETLRLLTAPSDAEPVAIAPGSPVVAVDDRVVALGGVVGGRETAVGEGTVSLAVEAANFPYVPIRRSQQANKVWTEASARFSRNVDPALPDLALARFAELLRLSCPDLVVTECHEWTAGDERRRTEIRVDLADASDVLGMPISADDLVDRLDVVGLKARLDNDATSLTCLATSYRSDVTGPADVLEEIVRLSGFDRLNRTMPLEPIPLANPDIDRVHREEARDAAVLAGLQEIITYSLTSPELQRALELDPNAEPPPYVVIQNPISPTRRVMRRSLLPELLATAARHRLNEASVQLFELGQVFDPTQPGEDERLPSEPYRLAFVLAGTASPPSVAEPNPRRVDAYDAVGVLRAIFDHLHVDGVRYLPSEVAPTQPGACASAVLHGVTLGYVGQLHPVVADRFELDQPVAIGELLMDRVTPAARDRFAIRPLSRYPSTVMDISVLVEDKTPIDELVSTAEDAAGGLGERVEVFDVFTNETLGPGKKAVGLRISFNAGDSTLTSAQAADALARVMEALAMSYGAVQR